MQLRELQRPGVAEGGENGSGRLVRVRPGELYKAALADVEWVSMAPMIHEMIRSNGHSLTFADQRSGVEPEIYLSEFFVGNERRYDLQQQYFRDYYWRDEAIPRLYGLGDGELVHKSRLYTDQEKKTSATYNEFRRVHKTKDGLFMGLDGGDGFGVVLSFGDSTEREGWGLDQIRAIKCLAPHIRQIARVRRAMVRAEALGASLAELLENRRSGFMQLDRRGRIQEANDLARDILLKRDGLCEEDGVLAARIEEEDAQLKRLLAQALPLYGIHGSGGWMKITRRKAGAPLVLEVHPVRGMGADYRAWAVGALVLVVDPAARPRVDPDLAAEVLGLTRTEGRVAVALAAGRTIAAIAAAQGCAESTVRMHLKRVYRKQGIHKQTELVRRVMSLEGLRGSSR